MAHGLLRVGGRVRGWEGGTRLLRVGWRVRGCEGGTRVTKGGMAGPWVGGWYTDY